jgi:hypothetical protein
MVSGVHFSSEPSIFQQKTKEACFAYDVKFPDGFNWVQGGKILGLWLGAYGATGGNNDVAGASCRVMWRSGGQAEAYVYVPQGQTSEFYSLPGYQRNNDKGQSLWRGSPFYFNTGTYNHVKLYVKMNTFTGMDANHDGSLHLSINGAYRSFDNMMWGENPLINVSGLLFQSFFGGSDSSWATPNEQQVYIKNVVTGNSRTACN